jgi:hypothetical protein
MTHLLTGSLVSNPFARKSQESKITPLIRATKQSLKKSNSFFEKVDEANERAIKGRFKGLHILIYLCRLTELHRES